MKKRIIGVVAAVTTGMVTIIPVGAAQAASAPLSHAVSHSVTTSSARLTCRASVTNSHPRDFTFVGIRVRTAAFAHIKTVAHYRTTDHTKRGVANAHGRRTIWYYISRATPGFKVVVDVFVTKRGRHAHCSTAFTPHR